AADEAVGGGDDAARPHAAVAPRDGPVTHPLAPLPIGTGKDVVPVAQDSDTAASAEETNAVSTYQIPGAAAHETIGIRNHAARSGAAVHPGHGPPPAVPVRTQDQAIAVGQREDAAADEMIRSVIDEDTDRIPGIAADEAVGGRDNPGSGRVSIEP